MDVLRFIESNLKQSTPSFYRGCEQHSSVFRCPYHFSRLGNLLLVLPKAGGEVKGHTLVEDDKKRHRAIPFDILITVEAAHQKPPCGVVLFHPSTRETRDFSLSPLEREPETGYGFFVGGALTLNVGVVFTIRYPSGVRKLR